jgi:hypothetical protein
MFLELRRPIRRASLLWRMIEYLLIQVKIDEIIIILKVLMINWLWLILGMYENVLIVCVILHFMILKTNLLYDLEDSIINNHEFLHFFIDMILYCHSKEFFAAER